MEDIAVIILCGGYSGRWANYLNIEKHFAVVNDTPIIENTLDILNSFNIKSTIITREDNKHLYENLNCDKVAIDAKYSTLEYYKIKSNYKLWAKDGKTIILMGDVLYTNAAIKKILFTSHAGIRFFGRQTKSFYTNCKHGELFAISFLPQHHIIMKLACERLALFIDKKKIKIAGGWGIYDIISGLEYLFTGESVIKGYVLFSNFNQIIDSTDDVDYPEDYNNYVQLFSQRSLFNRVNMFLTSKLFYFYKDLSNIIYEIKTSGKRTKCLEESQIK
jgi:GTP:adenosylcobinamide-phosphate guanylyltransferase